MSGTRLQALAARVHSPSRVSKYSEVAVAIEQWSTWLREYEVACGAGGVQHRVPDTAKITALRQLVPKELDLDIGRQAGLKDHNEVRKYISEQVVIRWEPYFVPTLGSKLADKGGDVNNVESQ